jgi:hypothetical protein
MSDRGAIQLQWHGGLLLCCNGKQENQHDDEPHKFEKPPSFLPIR